MSDDAPGASTRATALTEGSERYGKQLVSPLGRRNGGQRAPEHNRAIKLVPRGDGQRERRRTSAATVSAVDDLSQLEDVVGRHLFRCGERDERPSGGNSIGSPDP